MQMSSNELKEQGNRFYQAHRYDEAISSYTKAIIKSPEIAPLYTNRALAHLQTKSWDKALTDCRKAIDLDRQNVKAHYFLGRALTANEHFDEAIKSISRAHELAKTQKMQFGDEITSALRTARRDKFHKEEQERIQEEIELESYLMGLIEDDKTRKMHSIKHEADEPPTRLEQSDVAAHADKMAEQLKHLFKQVDDRRRERIVPDFLCGKISFEILREPVITPSGITYDRKDITEHLQRVGHFDPVTRAPLKTEQLIPNLAMREVVDHFLSENPWAMDTD